MKKVDVIILGAGAAGLMCGAHAGYRGRSVLIIDHAPKAAAKIRISGGGKCNFTNINAQPENYICRNPHFVKSALASYSPQDFIDLVDRHELDYEERELGKLFCLHRAGDLIQILRTESDWAGNQVCLKTDILSVEDHDSGYLLNTSEGAVSCQSLVVATGGLSFPKLKSSDLGYRLAKQFGLNITETKPGLVPLVLAGKWEAFCHDLSGISLDVAVSLPDLVEAPIFKEALLFTHAGLSGPAILQISNYWHPGQPVSINLFPEKNLYETLLEVKENNWHFHRWMQKFFPKKFVQAWLNLYIYPERLAEVSHETIACYAMQMQKWVLYPEKTAGYEKAEVTVGGVDTDMISSKDMQVKNQPGLYFIGEVLDVAGWLGGYNFQWAWASAVAAAKTV